MKQPSKIHMKHINILSLHLLLPKMRNTYTFFNTDFMMPIHRSSMFIKGTASFQSPYFCSWELRKTSGKQKNHLHWSKISLTAQASMYSIPLLLHHSMHKRRLCSGSWSSSARRPLPSDRSIPNSINSGWGSLEDSPRFCKRLRYSVWPKCEGTESALLPTHMSTS